MSEDAKLCCRCRKVRNVNEFGKRSSARDGLMSYCRGCKSQEDKQYLIEYGQLINGRRRTRRHNNLPDKERRNAYEKEKYHNGAKDVILVRKRRWYYNNKDRPSVKHQSRNYGRKYPEKIIAFQQRRRAVKNNVGGSFSASDWRNLIKASPVCHWCKKRWTRKLRPTHDHVVALSNGGMNTLENSVCSCLSCNSRKSNQRINPVSGQGILL
jgi:5-methylcytosine-specific restriction endonuclease McrA